jgi:hypothetical protein
VTPTVAGYKAVEEWRNQTPKDQRGEEGLDLHLTTLPEGADLTPTLRAQVEALLKRTDHAGADNPPLSVIFERYFIDRKPGPKTRLEWTGALARFTSAVGDLPVREITPAHVRTLKANLLTTKGRTGATLSPATVKKTLGALASVMSWAMREQYITSNPALGITARSGGRGGNEEARRLPVLRCGSHEALRGEAARRGQLLAALPRALHRGTPGGTWATQDDRRAARGRHCLSRHEAHDALLALWAPALADADALR